MIPEPLKIELQRPEIASLSDADAAAVLSAKTLTVRAPVDTSRVKQFAFTSGVWARIRLAMRNANATNDVYGLCVSVVDWIDDPIGEPVVIRNFRSRGGVVVIR